MRQSGRDWVATNLRSFPTVTQIEVIGEEFMRIHREDSLLGEKPPPFTAGIISAKRVSTAEIDAIAGKGQQLDFVANIPKDGVWEGAAIARAEELSLGWGGIGELMSAVGQPNVRGFEKKEFGFALQSIRQHTNVSSINRLYDRLLVVDRLRHGPLTVILLYEYELTAERIRQARTAYGAFSVIARTNPNGGPTQNAREIAASLGAEILQWGEFLGRLNKP
jgi:hypothetical protein